MIYPSFTSFSVLLLFPLSTAAFRLCAGFGAISSNIDEVLSPIIVELIDLANSVIVFLFQTTLH